MPDVGLVDTVLQGQGRGNLGAQLELFGGLDLKAENIGKDCRRG